MAREGTVPMNTRILTLAEAATLGPQGLNLLNAGVGAFNCTSFPAVVVVNLVGLFEYSASEAGDLRPYKIVVLDADGRHVGEPQTGPLEFPDSADRDGPHVPLQTGFITRLTLNLAAAGDYAIEVAIGGHLVGRVPFAAVGGQVAVQQ
jgi:hypothetical protein